MKDYKEKLNMKGRIIMFRNLGVVREAISNTELKVSNIITKEDVIVMASEDYVSSIKAELNSEDSEMMIIEYDLETKVVNEDIEE